MRPRIFIAKKLTRGIWASLSVKHCSVSVWPALAVTIILSIVGHRPTTISLPRFFPAHECRMGGFFRLNAVRCAIPGLKKLYYPARLVPNKLPSQLDLIIVLHSPIGLPVLITHSLRRPWLIAFGARCWGAALLSRWMIYASPTPLATPPYSMQWLPIL